MIEEHVLSTIEKYNMITQNDSIIVAVSGGPDSMCLLNILISLREKMNLTISVAHVNHMIREVANTETKYVEEFCKVNNIKCFVKKVDVLKLASEQKLSTEEAGRNVRYEFFEEIFNKIGANKIAIAHNKNDNVETVLMHIIRGSSIAGLTGIDPVRDNKYIRPLIETSRADIEKYCEDNNLNPKIDESNFENIYTRNKIRNMLIPYIKKEFNPNIMEAIDRLSYLATQESNFISRIIEESFKKVVRNENAEEIVLDLKIFNELDDFIKSKIILLCVQKLFNSTKGIEKVHIEDILNMCKKNIGNKYLTPNKNIKFFVNKGELKVSKITKK